MAEDKQHIDTVEEANRVLRERDRFHMGDLETRTPAIVAKQIGEHRRAMQSHLFFIRETEEGGEFATPRTSTEERMNNVLAHIRRMHILRRYMNQFSR